jgi:hypothetical protein
MPKSISAWACLQLCFADNSQANRHFPGGERLFPTAVAAVASRDRQLVRDAHVKQPVSSLMRALR